ncbi:hypothetical protein [Sphingomicrobium flavum]|uniref:hypothetical protein n=1 Tax=Sphingomicrobium flavum TaxID=1229164 RepID=UPI0021AE1876|nr:hypothetical protein [Sphingomicrobium flavum]
MTTTKRLGLGALAAACAIALALLHGAPTMMIMAYGAASGAGLLLGRLPLRTLAERAPPVSILIASVMVLVAIWGVGADEVRRWVALGPLRLQPSLFLIPLLLVAPAGRLWAFAMAIAALGLALQPDAATSAALLLALAVRAFAQPSGHAMVALAAAAAGLVFALMQADPLAPVRFIEHVMQDHVAAGAASLILALIGLLAGLAALWTRRAPFRSLLAFWLGLALASLAGAYPTPIIGLSVSAAFGFWISLSMMLGRRVDHDRRRPKIIPLSARR